MLEKKPTTKPKARPASSGAKKRGAEVRSAAKTNATAARKSVPTRKTTAVRKSATRGKAGKAKKTRAGLIALIAVVCALVLVGLIIGIYFATRKKPTPAEPDKPGHYTFREYVGTIGNPGIGYTRTDWYHTALGNTKVHDVQGDIVLFFVDLSPFSAGANGENVDHDLDASFFAALRGTFENCRKNGSTIAVRFRYDENGRDNPEPNSFAQVLKHIAQIKESGIFEDYKDILMFVESGFVGKWGEQHGGKYTSLEYKAQLLGAMLDCVPAPVPVTVRTPDIFAKFVGITRSELATYECKTGTDEYRVGLYDDGYMGSDSDLGTYADREKETTWLGRQTPTSYFGGEFSGNIEFAKKYSTYLPENCIREMYKTHLSYINGNIFQLYKDYTYSEAYAVAGIDNSAYYGQSVFQFIRDHLGYRFVLRTSDLKPKVERGGTLDASFTLENNGFANPVKAQKSEVILEREGEFVRTGISLDPTKWYSGSRINETLHLRIPANLAEGKWNVYLKFSAGNTDSTQFAFRSIRFANRDTWNETLGANYIGFFEVSGGASDETDDAFYEIGQPREGVQEYRSGGMAYQNLQNGANKFFAFGKNCGVDKKTKRRIARRPVYEQAVQTSKMKLNQKEVQLITELKNQEQLCVQKYDFYAKQAKDPELKKLFKKLLKSEQNHYDMLESLSTGTVPTIKSRTPSAVKYEPQATHTGDTTSKEFDKFLCTDIIATEKYVATTYNNDLFYFACPEVRNVLNAIMTDEQNHAEMIWKYKTANKMAA